MSLGLSNEEPNLYHGLGRLARQIEPSPSNGAGPITGEAADPYGEPGSTTPFTVYTYDKNSNLLTQSDALNHTTTYTYDHLNRQLTVACEREIDIGPATESK